MSRVRRRQTILKLLEKGPVPSQDALADALDRAGLGATQATISRDLRELGVVKAADGYRLASSAAAPSPSGPSGGALDAALRRHLISCDTAQNFVVLKTAPGHANVLALEFDRNPNRDVVGTVAGDDTIFLALRTVAAANRLAVRIRQLTGME